MKTSSVLLVLFVSAAAQAGHQEEAADIIQKNISVKVCADMLLDIKEPGKTRDEFDVLISKEGVVQDITFQSATPGMGAYFGCLKTELQKLKFPVAPDKKDYHYQSHIDWSFHGDKEPGYVPGEMDVKTHEEDLQKQNSIRDHVFTAKKELWACYADYKSRAKKQAKSGTIRLSWTVYGSGMASKVIVNENEFNDIKLADCVSAIITRMKFPATLGSDVVEIVKFPITFTKKK